MRKSKWTIQQISVFLFLCLAMVFVFSCYDKTTKYKDLKNHFLSDSDLQRYFSKWISKERYYLGKTQDFLLGKGIQSLRKKVSNLSVSVDKMSGQINQNLLVRFISYKTNRRVHEGYTTLGDGIFIQTIGTINNPIAITLTHPLLEDKIKKTKNSLERLGYYLGVDELMFGSHKNEMFRKVLVYPYQSINANRNGLTATIYPGFYKSQKIGMTPYYHTIIKLRIFSREQQLITANNLSLPQCYHLSYDSVKKAPIITPEAQPVPIFVICGSERLKSVALKEGVDFSQLEKYTHDILLRIWSYYTGKRSFLPPKKLVYGNESFNISSLFRNSDDSYPTHIYVYFRTILASVRARVFKPVIVKSFLEIDTFYFVTQFKDDRKNSIQKNCSVLSHELMHYFLYWSLRRSTKNSNSLDWRKILTIPILRFPDFYNEQIATWVEEELCDGSPWRSGYENLLNGQVSTISWNSSQNEIDNVHWRVHGKVDPPLFSGYSASLLLRAFPFRENYLSDVFLGKTTNIFDYLFTKGTIIANGTNSQKILERKKAEGYFHFAKSFATCKLFKNGAYYNNSLKGQDEHKDLFGIIRQEWGNNPKSQADFYDQYPCRSYVGGWELSTYYSELTQASVVISDNPNPFTDNEPSISLIKKLAPVVDYLFEQDSQVRTVHMLEMIPYSSLYTKMSLLDLRNFQNKKEYSLSLYLYVKNDQNYTNYLQNFMKHFKVMLIITNDLSVFEITKDIYEIFSHDSKIANLIDRKEISQSYVRSEVKIPILEKTKREGIPADVYILLVNGNSKGVTPNCDPASCKSSTKINVQIGFRVEIRPLDDCQTGLVRDKNGECSCPSPGSIWGKSCSDGFKPLVVSQENSEISAQKRCECVPKCSGNQYWNSSTKSCYDCPPNHFNPYFENKPLDSPLVKDSDISSCFSCDQRIRYSVPVWKSTKPNTICGVLNENISYGKCVVSCECPASFSVVKVGNEKYCYPPCKIGEIWDEEQKKCKPCGPKQIDLHRRTCVDCPSTSGNFRSTFFFRNVGVCGTMGAMCSGTNRYYHTQTGTCETCPSGSFQRISLNQTPSSDPDGLEQYARCRCTCNGRIVIKGDSCPNPPPSYDNYCCPENHIFNINTEQCVLCPDYTSKFSNGYDVRCVPCDSSKGFSWDREDRRCKCLSGIIKNGICQAPCKQGQIIINGSCYWEAEIAPSACYQPSVGSVGYCARKGYTKPLSCSVTSSLGTCYCPSDTIYTTIGGANLDICRKNRNFNSCVGFCKTGTRETGCVEAYEICCPSNTTRVQISGKYYCK